MKNFKVKILSYLLLGFFFMVGGTYSFYQDNGMVLSIICGIAIAIILYYLFQTIDRTNKEIADFLLNIKYDDYAVTYTQQKQETESFVELHGAFNVINEKFRDIRSQKEAQFQYLQAIVENVDAGLICFDQDGRTILMNRALQQLLHKSYFPTLTAVQKYDEGLWNTFQDIQPSERKLVKVLVDNQILQLAIRTTILKIGEEQLQLFAMQNIQAELEEQEVASWQKLIRILTHEIMNSVAPVVSLSETTKELIDNNPVLEDEVLSDVKMAVKAIHKRSQGLLNFTQTYRQLTKIPPPKFQQVNPVELLDTIFVLFKPSFKKKGIELIKQFATYPIVIQADPDLLEQVLINLIKNGMEAFDKTKNPQLTVSVFKDGEGLVQIQIADNGVGIPAVLQEQIFIPFFTTKDEGSGIGLSLCRQIIHLHKGSLSLNSEEGVGSVFVVRL